MKIRINNRVFDMPGRCFEFSPTAKEMKFDTRSSADSCSSQSAGAVQSVRGADTAGGQKPHKAINRHC